MSVALWVYDLVGVEAWANERIDWLRRMLKLGSGIPPHDTFGRLFGPLDRGAVEKRLCRWGGSVLPVLAAGTVVAIDGKASPRSKMTGQWALHLVTPFATEVQPILGQEACAEKSNELVAIAVLHAALLAKYVILTIDAMGIHSDVAQAIRDREADCVLPVKATSRRCRNLSRDPSRSDRPRMDAHVSNLYRVGGDGSLPTGGPALLGVHPTGMPREPPAVGRSEDVRLDRRGTHDQRRTSHGGHGYIGRIAANASTLAKRVRADWGIENRVQWCLGSALNDHQMRTGAKKPGPISPSSVGSSSICFASIGHARAATAPVASLPIRLTPTARPFTGLA